MPVPLLAPLIGSLVASSIPAIGAGVTTALGAAATTGIGSLVASAAPAAIGAGIGTLAAGGNAGEALANAASFGIGGAALGNLAPAAAEGAVAAGGARAAGAEVARGGLNPLTALQMAGSAGMGGQAPTIPMQGASVQRGQPSQAAAGSPMMMLPQQAATPSPMAGAPMNVTPVGFTQQSAPPMMGADMAGQPMTYPMGGIASAMMQRGMQPYMMADGGYVEGPGTGRSDSIPATIYQDGQPVQEARLSDGEFVMTERAVRGAGGGDRAKGAAKMYRMMKEFERGGRV